MKKAILIGDCFDEHGDPDAIWLPEDVVTQTIGILARKGGGKTYAATLLAEGMLDLEAQVIAIEPVGKWWALRLGKDGRSRGKDIFVMGGQRGDVPLAPEAGKLVAQALVEKRISAVLDLTFMRKGQRHRFLAEFGEEFLHLKQKQAAPTPVHIFLEEAQTVVPQMARHGGPAEMQMLGAWEDVVRLGRNAGIGVTLISQRPQSVNKEALSQVEALFALGVNEVAGRKAIEAWVQEKGAERSIIGELPGLETGEAILWSPSWLRFFGRVKIREKSTFDSSATVKLGRRRAVGKLPKADVESLRTAMASAVELAEREDPKALRSQIAVLKAELKKAQERPAPKLEHVRPAKRVEVPVLKDAQVKRLDRLVGRLLKSQDWLAQAQQAVVAEAGNLRTEVHKVLDLPSPPPPSRAELDERVIARASHLIGAAKAHAEGREPKGNVPVVLRSPVVASDKDGAATGTLSAYAMGLLQTLAQRHPMTMTRSQLAILSGRSAGSSAFAGAMAELVRKGLIYSDGRGRVNIADEGKALVGMPPAPRTGKEIREHWLRALPGYESALLKALIDLHPRALTREELARNAGKSVTSSAFAGACSTLIKNELVEAPSPGNLRAADTLMED